MKKIILLVSVVLFGCVGYAQAQTSEKKLSRQERKEAKRAMEQALFEEAKQAIENKSFTLEAEIFFITAVIFAVIDTFSCAHYLDFSGRDDTLVLYTVSMF